MSPDRWRLQPLTRTRVASLGAEGEAWLDALPSRVAELEQRWDVTVQGRSLAGGSASWVARARTSSGDSRVIKMAVPGHDLGDEAHVLGVGEGRGLVRLFGHDAEHQALLLEELGRPLALSGLGVEATLDHLVAALREVWTVPTATFALPAAGEDKASTLAALVSDADRRLGGVCPPAVLDRALSYAARRTAAHDASRCVVVHGDPHPANALATAQGEPLPYRFVDPDGFLADPAYDLGVVLREWTELGQHPREQLWTWCTRLAKTAGQDAEAAWEWGFLERVATALHVLDFGAERLGRRLLASTTALL